LPPARLRRQHAGGWRIQYLRLRSPKNPLEGRAWGSGWSGMSYDFAARRVLERDPTRRMCQRSLLPRPSATGLSPRAVEKQDGVAEVISSTKSPDDRCGRLPKTGQKHICGWRAYSSSAKRRHRYPHSGLLDIWSFLLILLMGRRLWSMSCGRKKRSLRKLANGGSLWALTWRA